MNLLTPDPGLLFWMVLSFLIVFFLLAKYGFPIIVDAINKRKEFIETSLVSAKEANERLATIKEEGEKLLAEAKAQQKEIISAAMQEKQKILLAAQDEARTSAQQIVDDAAARIAAEKEKALREVRSEVATLAIDIAEKVLSEKMSSSAEQKKAIERMIEKL
ncbi:MAG: F0F1 ATP synthase subunit B [Bacteroidaceae bacterium]|nr:F0F1 ATP synthase subunit B [Bacteroidaceae bacterium]